MNRAFGQAQQNQPLLQSVQDQVKALYTTDTASGISGAETYADMLKLQLSQSQGYWSARDPTNNNEKQIMQGKLDVLQKAATQASGASVAQS
jgi:EAL domain-containing protein (putative c-di-GMP-specific phosphodiesterase class I)